jgi:hypothetical protein
MPSTTIYDQLFNRVRGIVIVIVAIVAIVGLEVVACADGQTAETLYADGQTAYDRADYAAAIAKWQESYQLSGESGLLFNLAQARRLAGNCAEALATYRRFLAADPAADQQHDLARELTRELEAQCGEHGEKHVEHVERVEYADRPRIDSKPASGDLGHDPHDHGDNPGSTLRIAGLMTGGVSLATIATGLYFGHRAQTLANEVTTACSAECDWAVWRAKDAAGRRDATIGHVLDVTGAVGVVGGGILYYLGIRSPVTVVPTSREGGVGIAWSGSW